jgi:hypothetical protein
VGRQDSATTRAPKVMYIDLLSRTTLYARVPAVKIFGQSHGHEIV